MPFQLEVVAVLATFVYPNNIVYGDELTCRLPATSSGLGISMNEILFARVQQFTIAFQFPHTNFRISNEGRFRFTR